MSRLGPVAEAAQADYERLRAAVVAGAPLATPEAARFARAGLWGLMRRSAAEPVFVARLLGAGRPAWTPYGDPRLAALAAAYELVLEAPARGPRRGDRIMRVAIYARVSTDAQEARGTIGSQLESLRERVAADGHQLVASFVDDGFSGARLDRPGLDALRDAAEAGEIEALWCLTPDRLSRSYAYQLLIADELARHGVAIRYLDAPDIASDPQARLLTQVQSVIAEYERAKISERSRRGKLYRARAGEAVHWRAPFGYVRVPRQGERAAHLVVNEEQAALMRRIFAGYTSGGLSLRQITLRLNAEGVPTPEGKRWITSTLGRMLKREAYVGRAWVNTTKMVDDRGPGRRPRQVPRPRSEWIAVPCPRIVDDATFEAAVAAGRDNTNFSARRLDPDEEDWLLRGLVFCACGTRSIVDRGSGASPTGIRYYACRNRCGLTTQERRCREGNVRADALDEFVFAEIRGCARLARAPAGRPTGSRRPPPRSRRRDSGPERWPIGPGRPAEAVELGPPPGEHGDVVIRAVARPRSSDVFGHPATRASRASRGLPGPPGASRGLLDGGLHHDAVVGHVPLDGLGHLPGPERHETAVPGATAAQPKSNA